MGCFVDAYFALERNRESGYDPNMIASQASGYAGAVMFGIMGAYYRSMFRGPVGALVGSILGYCLGSGQIVRDFQQATEPISTGDNNPALFILSPFS